MCSLSILLDWIYYHLTVAWNKPTTCKSCTLNVNTVGPKISTITYTLGPLSICQVQDRVFPPLQRHSFALQLWCIPLCSPLRRAPGSLHVQTQRWENLSGCQLWTWAVEVVVGEVGRPQEVSLDLEPPHTRTHGLLVELHCTDENVVWGYLQYKYIMMSNHQAWSWELAFNQLFLHYISWMYQRAWQRLFRDGQGNRDFTVVRYQHDMAKCAMKLETSPAERVIQLSDLL